MINVNFVTKSTAVKRVFEDIFEKITKVGNRPRMERLFNANNATRPMIAKTL